MLYCWYIWLKIIIVRERGDFRNYCSQRSEILATGSPRGPICKTGVTAPFFRIRENRIFRKKCFRFFSLLRTSWYLRVTRPGTFCHGDVLSWGRFVMGTFCHADVLSWGLFVLGTFCLRDVLSLGTFCPGTFCLWGRFVFWHFLHGDILSLGTFCHVIQQHFEKNPSVARRGGSVL